MYIYIHLLKFSITLSDHFNSCMTHSYDNAFSHMPYHSDNENYIESNSIILLLSYYDTRKFNN